MLAGSGISPYDAADIFDGRTAAWRPYLWSPDAQLNLYRDRIVSRVRDLVRNDGWAAGSVTRTLDNAIGANFRPIFKPDYRALAQISGNRAFDATWAEEFGRAVQSAWRRWANDPGRWCDAQRHLSISQLMRLAFRHKLVDGDALAILRWMPERMGEGRAQYATVLQLIDPDRLSNPYQQFDQQAFRGGVQVDEYGAAIGYWIRKAHIGDWWAAAQAMTWEYIPRETEWGRPIVVHDFEVERAGQHRGGAGILTPVVQRLKMLVKYDATELDAAIVNAIFASYIESPFDPELVQSALGDSAEINQYQQLRSSFHDERKIMLGDARMPILFPGERINTVNATRPAANFKDFESAVLRNVASGMGLSAQQVSNDWSDVNYSSARGALLEAWKTLARRREEFAQNFAQPVAAAWMEEAFDREDFPLPANAPSFIEARAAYSRARWMGPGRGWIDPTKEKEGAILGMDAGLSTLENECAENAGEDYEDVLDQRAREVKAFRERGLEPPTWANLGGMPSRQTVQDPEEE
ncbi:MAG: phage portal protein [Betaproteobacteria bacterium]|nr:phage portal protein [Betaproteobacteria bacterium]